MAAVCLKQSRTPKQRLKKKDFTNVIKIWKQKDSGNQNNSSMETFKPLPVPYYAVIFSSLRTEGDNGYDETAQRMEELARQQPGFLGIESAQNETGYRVTICFWSSLEAIHDWKQNSEHLIAQEKGIEKWYAGYRIRICKVERDYGNIE